VPWGTQAHAAFCTRMRLHALNTTSVTVAPAWRERGITQRLLLINIQAWMQAPRDALTTHSAFRPPCLTFATLSLRAWHPYPCLSVTSLFLLSCTVLQLPRPRTYASSCARVLLALFQGCPHKRRVYNRGTALQAFAVQICSTMRKMRPPQIVFTTLQTIKRAKPGGANSAQQAAY